MIGANESEASKITGLNPEDDDPDFLKRLKQTIRNKFNYSERQCQTLNNKIREKCISTSPPHSYGIALDINQWKIFDAYMKAFKEEDDEELRLEEENKGKDKTKSSL